MLKEIIKLNSLPHVNQDNVIIHTLYFFKSMINHSENPNLEITYLAPHVAFMYAKEDIEAGAELVVDYCDGILDVS